MKMIAFDTAVLTLVSDYYHFFFLLLDELTMFETVSQYPEISRKLTEHEVHGG